MRLRTGFISMMLISIMFLSSCVTSHDFSEKISCSEFNAYHNQHGITFEVEVGDKIRIELCSNITTGFRWTYEISDEGVLQLEDYDYKEPEDDLAGTAGTDVWTFEAVGEGTTEVSMEYSQGWLSGTEAEWTYTVTVNVE